MYLYVVSKDVIPEAVLPYFSRLVWSLEFGMGRLGKKPWGSTCLWLPSSGVASHHTQNFFYVGARNGIQVRILMWQVLYLLSHFSSLRILVSSVSLDE